MAKIPLPLWLIAPAESLDIDPLEFGSFKGFQNWIYVKRKGVDHVLAFTCLEKVENYAKLLHRPQDYINAELDAMALRKAFGWILRLPIERLLVDERLELPIAPFLAWLDKLPEAAPDFGTS